MANVNLGTIEVRKNNVNTTPENPKKMGLWDWFNVVGTGMSTFGTSMIDPAKGTALTNEIIEQNRKAKQKDISGLYNDWKAKTTYEIWSKHKQGLPLQQWEKDFADIKNPNEPPSEMDLWKQAEKETLAAMGGTGWVALSSDKQKQYYPGIENRFLELKKQFGLQTKDDQVKRARRKLREKGYVDSPEAVAVFFKNNPNF